MKQFLVRALSIGLTPELSNGKKFAIQVATVDAYFSLVTFLFYIIHTLQNGQSQLLKLHVFLFVSMIIGLVLLRRKYHDIGRFYIHQTGLLGMFLCVDAFGINSGFEYYYFTSILVPHITFSLEELWKGAFLSATACVVFIVQQLYGAGYIMDRLAAPPEEKIISIIFVVCFTLTVLITARWRLREVKKEVEVQQEALIHSSKMVVLGEVASNIAHEINNPLQSLSLRLTVLKDMINEDKHVYLDKLNETVMKIGRVVQAFNDLSISSISEVKDNFIFHRTLEDVLVLNAKKIKESNISIYVEGESSLPVSCESFHVSQVLTSLVHHSIAAVENLEEKWIRIQIEEKKNFLHITVTDSGKSMQSEEAIDLSSSSILLEKSKGSLYRDMSGSNNKIVMLLPIA